MKHYYLIIIFLAFCGCNNPQEKESNCYLKDTLISNTNGIPKDSLTYYFPKKVYRDSSFILSNLDTFKLDWYSVDLKCFQEPILFNFYLKKDIYRFLWMRSFNDDVLISIEKTNDRITLNTKRLDRHPEFLKIIFGATFIPPMLSESDANNLKELKEIRQHNKFVKKARLLPLKSKIDSIHYPSKFAKIKLNDSKTLTEKEWKMFLGLLDESKFWEMTPVDNNSGCDGSQWVLEGHTRNRYWFVERWSPKGSIRNCCEYLIQLSAVKDERIY